MSSAVAIPSNGRFKFKSQSISCFFRANGSHVDFHGKVGFFHLKSMKSEAARQMPPRGGFGLHADFPNPDGVLRLRSRGSSQCFPVAMLMACCSDAGRTGENSHGDRLGEAGPIISTFRPCDPLLTMGVIGW